MNHPIRQLGAAPLDPYQAIRSGVRLRHVIQDGIHAPPASLDLPFITEEVALSALIAKRGSGDSGALCQVHGHIVDVHTFDAETVATLNQAHLPLTVILGGTGDLSLGTALARSGAFWVIDKGRSGFIGRVLGWAIRLAALGLVARHPFTSEQIPLGCLAVQPILTLSEWMDACSLSRRRLEQLCAEWTGLPPAKTLRVCQAMKFALAEGPKGAGGDAFFGAEEFEMCRRSFWMLTHEGA